MDDQTLRDSIIAELDRQPQVESANIDVLIDNGVVTLTGHVSSRGERLTAESVVKRMRGVRAVVQAMEVRAAGLPGAPDRHPGAAAIAVMRPKLPTADQLEPWLRQIDDNRWYANFGPLELLFRERLGELAGLTSDHLGLFSSGASALAVALRAMVGKTPGVCLMPSWTHVGTASAATAAGLQPRLVDCDPQTWAIDPAAVNRHTGDPSVRAVVVVAPFGAKLDYEAWDRFSRESGVPVAIDAAAGFDQFVNFGKSISWGRTPVMVSLHATKGFGVGEGGLLLSGDPDLIMRAQQLSNFGIYEDRPIDDAFGNHKISEYAAAVGLAALDGWAERRKSLAVLASEMRRRLGASGVRTAPGFGGEFVTSTCMVSVPGLKTDELERVLAAERIGARRWWRDGLHSLPAFQHCDGEDLAVTREIARSYLGVPFYADMPEEHVDRVIDVLSQSASASQPPLPRD